MFPPSEVVEIYRKKTNSFVSFEANVLLSPQLLFGAPCSRSPLTSTQAMMQADQEGPLSHAPFESKCGGSGYGFVMSAEAHQL